MLKSSRPGNCLWAAGSWVVVAFRLRPELRAPQHRAVRQDFHKAFGMLDLGNRDGHSDAAQVFHFPVVPDDVLGEPELKRRLGPTGDLRTEIPDEVFVTRAMLLRFAKVLDIYPFPFEVLVLVDRFAEQGSACGLVLAGVQAGTQRGFQPLEFEQPERWAKKPYRFIAGLFCAGPVDEAMELPALAQGLCHVDFVVALTGLNAHIGLFRFMAFRLLGEGHGNCDRHRKQNALHYLSSLDIGNWYFG